MSPTDSRDTASTISDLRSELAAQRRDLSSILDATDTAQLTRRPPSGKWSVVEHIDHLVKVNEKYAAALEAAVEKGREKERIGRGPFRGSLLGRAFTRTMEPPVSMRMKTIADMEPAPTLDPESTLGEFSDVQCRLDGILQASEGLDLDRIRTSSPFLRLLRAPVFSWFCVLSAHNRRHIWLIRETLEQLEGVGD